MKRVIAVAGLLVVPLLANGQTIGTGTKTFRTAWGDPDLQGTWNNSTTTPLERPETLGNRAALTNEEVAALDTAAVGRFDRPPPTGDPGTYNDFWWEIGTRLQQTSLIVDPANGRLPPFTPQGTKRKTWRQGVGSWADRNLAERCVTRGAPKRPGGYNNNFQILQIPGFVFIFQEMIHEVRIIPLDGRPHIDKRIRLWMGDSRGHWNGDTLVVETTNFTDKIMFNSFNCCTAAGENLTLIERFTRVDSDIIDHRYTVNDPSVYARPWTAAIPMRKTDAPIYEYACHEGNYGMYNLLNGARVQERERTGIQEPK